MYLNVVVSVTTALPLSPITFVMGLPCTLGTGTVFVAVRRTILISLIGLFDLQEFMYKVASFITIVGSVGALDIRHVSMPQPRV